MGQHLEELSGLEREISDGFLKKTSAWVDQQLVESCNCYWDAQHYRNLQMSQVMLIKYFLFNYLHDSREGMGR